MRTIKKQATGEDVLRVGNLLTDILKRLDSIEQAVVSNDFSTKPNEDMDVQEMFDILHATDLPRSTHRFVQSLWYDFDLNGFLSREQYRCLKRNYDKWVNGVSFQVR